jgi:hypothetical protein
VTGTELPEGTGSKGGQAAADAYGKNYTGDLASASFISDYPGEGEACDGDTFH